MWYLAECTCSDLTAEQLEEISKNARQYFGDPGYHIVAEVDQSRFVGLFEAEISDEVEYWLFRHGATVESMRAFSSEAVVGRVHRAPEARPLAA